MKKIGSIIMLLMLALGVFAQQDITKFNGIAVHGSKEAMISKLKAAGFLHDGKVNCDLVGTLNGRPVFVQVLTNNGQVYRVCIIDQDTKTASEIIADYNALCEKFMKDPAYVSLPFDQKLTTSTEVLNNLESGNRQYQAIFFQKPTEANPHNMIEKYKNKPVWFTIYKSGDGYGISIYYDNTYNQDPSKALR